MNGKEALNRIIDNVNKYTNIDIEQELDVIAKDEAELEELQRTVKDCITLLTQSGSNTKEQVLEKLKGLIG